MSGQGLWTASKLIACCISILLFIFIMAGCSNSANIPSTPENPEVRPLDLTPIDYDGGKQMLWGYYSGYANAEESVFELTPLRTAEEHFNLVKMMNTTGGLAVQVMPEDSDPGNRRLNVRIIMVNPYATAPKFSGFDVRGILITGGSRHFGNGLWTAGKNHAQLLNLDGLTRWWNPVEFYNPGYFGYVDGFYGNYSFGQYDARLNAFKMFADSLPETDVELYAVNTPGLDDDDGRGVFTNNWNARRYDIQFPKGDTYFNYAIDVCWAEPSWPPEVPDDFPPYANRDEAWYVRGEIVYNDLEYTPGFGTTGYLDIYVYVSDWQGRMLGQVAPQVSSVNLYSDDLFGSSVGHATLNFDNGKQGIYLANLSDICSADGPGIYTVGIEVVSSVGSYKQGWQAAAMAPLAAYDTMMVEVTGTAPPLQKKFGVHAFVLAKTDGSSPAVTDSEINEDINWTDIFYQQYGFSLELVKRTYINASEYYNLDPADAHDLFMWQHDSSGLINLYYVNSFVGEAGLAFAHVGCYYETCTAQSTYVMFDSTACEEFVAVLAHEFGHNLGMLQDMYLIDNLDNCLNAGNYYGCPHPGDFFCQEPDATSANLMYWAVPGNYAPNDFWMSMEDIEMTTQLVDSQAENITYFHLNYPSAYKGL